MKNIFGFILFALSIPAFSSGWTEVSTVHRLVVTGNGTINVRLSPELSGCTSVSGYGTKYASLYPEHPGFNAIHSNLLMAYASGKEVRIFLSDSTCKIGETVLGGSF